MGLTGLSLCMSLCRRLVISLSHTPTYRLSVYMHVCVSVCVCLTVSGCLSPSVCLSVCLAVCVCQVYLCLFGLVGWYRFTWSSSWEAGLASRSHDDPICFMPVLTCPLM